MTVQSNKPTSSEVLVPNTILQYKEPFLRTSPAVYWLRFGASTAGGMGSISGRRTRILNAEGHGQKKKSHFSLEERLSPALGQEIYKMSPEHL